VTPERGRPLTSRSSGVGPFGGWHFGSMAGFALRGVVHSPDTPKAHWNSFPARGPRSCSSSVQAGRRRAPKARSGLNGKRLSLLCTGKPVPSGGLVIRMFPHSGGQPFGDEKCCSLVPCLPPRPTRIGRENQGAAASAMERWVSPEMEVAQRLQSCSSNKNSPLPQPGAQRPGSTRLMKLWFSARGLAAMTETNGSPPSSGLSQKGQPKLGTALRTLLFRY
jgi:hypothetical protein